MSWKSQFLNVDQVESLGAYLVDVLALKLGDQGVEARLVSLNTDGLKDGLDVGSGGRGVSTESEKEVCREVLHFECGCRSKFWVGTGAQSI